jgi:hypothetical protein
MAQFVWTSPCGTGLINADDRDQAIRKIIASRMQAGESVGDALRHFRKNDDLFQLDCEPLEIEPYFGDLPDDQ